MCGCVGGVGWGVGGLPWRVGLSGVAAHGAWQCQAGILAHSRSRGWAVDQPGSVQAAHARQPADWPLLLYAPFGWWPSTPRRQKEPRLRLLIIEQPDPEGGQAADKAPRAAVGAAHLQKALEPHLGHEADGQGVDANLRK